MNRRTLFAVLLALTLVGSSVASAAGPVGWVFAQRWEELTPDQRKKALQNYRKHKKRSQKEQRDVEERYQRWKNMPAHDRDRVRKRFKGSPLGGLLD